MAKAVYYSLTSLPYHLSVFTVQTSYYVTQFLILTFFDDFLYSLNHFADFLFFPSHAYFAGVMHADVEYKWRKLVYNFKCMMKKIGRAALICAANWMLESIGLLFSSLLDSTQDLSEWRYRSLWEKYYIFWRVCGKKQEHTHILHPQTMDQIHPIMKGAVSSWTHPQRKIQGSHPPALSKPPIMVPIPTP